MQHENGHRNPVLTVDGLLVEDGRLVLVRRGREPFAGLHALPGGFVEWGESTEDAVRREMREETGLQTEVTSLMGVYSDPGRDPRGHTVSVVYVLKRTGGKLEAGDDADEAAWFHLQSLPPLAFDHGQIVSDYLIGLKK
ncbi:MAG: NUDIX hydrolase [Candidatus Methanomethylophilaceae archaeon]|nr:NUDIX hydrolase [Candidatus Methanomethylophilaceae archaeon]